jgi:hypothetical protein
MLPVPPRREPEQPDTAAEAPTPAAERVPRDRFALRIPTLLVALATGFVALACLLDPITVVLSAIVIAVAARAWALASGRWRGPAAPSPAPAERPSARALDPLKGQTALALACVLWTYALWAHFRPPSDRSLDTGGISSVRVWNSDPLLDERLEPPDATAYNPAIVDDLVTVLRTAKETPDHKCSSAGVIHLQRPFGFPERLEFLPGHDPQWYEFRHGRKAYRVPRAEFVAAMKRVGVDVPLTCP